VGQYDAHISVTGQESFHLMHGNLFHFFSGVGTLHTLLLVTCCTYLDSVWEGEVEVSSRGES
jgi:hypothetical protein